MFRHGRSENGDAHHKTVKTIAQHAAEECNGLKDTKRSPQKLDYESVVEPAKTKWTQLQKQLK